MEPTPALNFFRHFNFNKTFKTATLTISQTLELKWRFFKNEKNHWYGAENDVDLSKGELKIMNRPIHVIEKKLGYICHQNGGANSMKIRFEWNIKRCGGIYKRHSVIDYEKCASLKYLLKIQNLLHKNAPKNNISDLIFEFLNLQWVFSKLKECEVKEKRNEEHERWRNKVTRNQFYRCNFNQIQKKTGDDLKTKTKKYKPY